MLHASISAFCPIQPTKLTKGRLNMLEPAHPHSRLIKLIAKCRSLFTAWETHGTEQFYPGRGAVQLSIHPRLHHHRASRTFELFNDCCLMNQGPTKADA